MKKLFFLVVFIFAFFISFNQISDFDTWFHLKTGEYIVQHKSIPHTDPFSFTAGDREWILHDWLTEIAYYAIFCVAGFNGLIMFNSLILAITFLLVFKTAMLYKNPDKDDSLLPYTAFIAIFLAILISKFRFCVRPYTMSFFFLSVFGYIIRLYKIKGKNYLWALPILIIFWCNMHYGYVFGLAFIAFFCAGEILKWAGKLFFDFEPKVLYHKNQIKYICTILFISIAYSFMNPYGWRLPFYGFELQSVLAVFPIMEHMNTILKGFPVFTITAVIFLLLFLLNIKKVDFSEFIIFAGFLLLALYKPRFMPKFAIVTAPVFAYQFFATLDKFSFFKSKKFLFYTCLFSVVIPVAIFSNDVSHRDNFGFGTKSKDFPEKAVRFLKENNISGNMFNPYHFGGYLNWASYPETKVFVDGRLVFFGPDTLQKFSQITDLHPLWKVLMSETKVDFVLFSPCPLLYALRGSEDWALVYWDDVVCIYIRNLPKNKDTINRYEYKFINPADRMLSYLEGAKKTKINQTIHDVKQKLLQDNDCEIAHLFLAYCYNKKSKKDLELLEYKEALRINPRSVNAYNNIGTYYANLDNYSSAKTYFLKALDIIEYSDISFASLGEIYHKNMQLKKAYKMYKKAIQLNNINYNAHNNLGSLYLSWSKYAEADMEFRTAIGINPAIPDAWYNLACLNALNRNLLGFSYYLYKTLVIAKDKKKYIDMARKEYCFESFRNRKLFTKLLEHPYKNAKPKKKKI